MITTYKSRNYSSKAVPKRGNEMWTFYVRMMVEEESEEKKRIGEEKGKPVKVEKRDDYLSLSLSFSWLLECHTWMLKLSESNFRLFFSSFPVFFLSLLFFLLTSFYFLLWLWRKKLTSFTSSRKMKIKREKFKVIRPSIHIAIGIYIYVCIRVYIDINVWRTVSARYDGT